MKIGIYSARDAGIVKDTSIDYIAADYGIVHLLKQNIQPVIAIGDFDTLEDRSILNNVEVITFPAKKDESDTELALMYAIKQGYSAIDIYGVTGGRLDHFMATLCLLEKYQQYDITIYDESNKIRLLRQGHHELDINTDSYFSLFALDEVTISLKNCLYPIEDYTLVRSDPLCLSNQSLGRVVIDTDNLVLLIESR
ncbi:MAG: thiamine diphosphokinase [Erysipelotrichaceae bacterium]|nr:thiamine diphosphokinase [Erysipelotrichaceae bacterium]